MDTEQKLSGRKAREILGFQVTINENFGLTDNAATFATGTRVRAREADDRGKDEDPDE